MMLLTAGLSPLLHVEQVIWSMKKLVRKQKFKLYQTPILKQKTMLLLVEKSSRLMLLTIGNI